MRSGIALSEENRRVTGAHEPYLYVSAGRRGQQANPLNICLSLESVLLVARSNQLAAAQGVERTRGGSQRPTLDLY